MCSPAVNTYSKRTIWASTPDGWQTHAIGINPTGIISGNERRNSLVSCWANSNVGTGPSLRLERSGDEGRRVWLAGCSEIRATENCCVFSPKKRLAVAGINRKVCEEGLMLPGAENMRLADKETRHLWKIQRSKVDNYSAVNMIGRSAKGETTIPIAY